MRAREFAKKAHGKQKYGKKPYIVHLDAVAKIVQKYGNTAMIVAYLHDILEDTKTSKTAIEQQFGLFVSDCVEIITDEKGRNRKERKAKTYQKIKNASAAYNIAVIVKVADRLANVSACHDTNGSLLRMYRIEHSDFRKFVLIDGLCDDLWQQIALIIA